MKGTCWIAMLFVCVSVCAQPKIAIIMDDVGYNLDRGMRAARLPAAITLAVLPFTANAQALSQTARDLGKEVILHQPLESLVERRPAAGTLTLAMSPSSIQRNFAQALEWLPNCIGVSNHAGSRFTQDPDSMNALMEVVRRRGLFYVDSRTTPDTVAQAVAKRWGVPFVRRDVFLDHKVNREFIEKAFALALRIAARRGYVVVIAHPHLMTIEFLEQVLPTLSNVSLVPVSELVESTPEVSINDWSIRPAALVPLRDPAFLRISRIR